MSFGSLRYGMVRSFQRNQGSERQPAIQVDAKKQAPLNSQLVAIRSYIIERDYRRLDKLEDTPALRAGPLRGRATIALMTGFEARPTMYRNGLKW